MKILIGADPEVFVEDKEGNLICAHDMVKGTKDQPFPVKFGAVQVDGMALEFNIDPASTMEEFVHNITVVKQALHEMIGVSKYNLLSSPSVFFSEKVMQNASPLALMLGCEPDFNAWLEGRVNFPPNPDTNMRTGAGHLHIGWAEGLDVEDESHNYDCIDVVKQLDCSLGVQSLLWDEDTDRRKMYGAAGAYRTKPYGVEYRVLSNAWLRSESLISHVYSVAIKSVEDFFSGIKYFDVVNADRIINEADQPAAIVATKMLYEEFDLPNMGQVYV